MNLQKGKHTPGTHNNQATRAPYNSNSRIQSSLPVTHISQVPRTEDYLRQGPGYTQQLSGLHHYSVGPVASVTGSPHDMSKQAALPSQAQNNQGLYSNTSGVAGAGNPQQQQPPAMPGATSVPSPHPSTPGPRPPAPGVVHQQPPHLPTRGSFYQQPQRSSVLRNYTPQPVGWTSAMNHATQQTQNQFPGGQLYFQSPYPNMQQTQFLRGSTPNQVLNLAYSQQFSPSTQYPNIQAATQTQLMYNPGAPAYYSPVPGPQINHFNPVMYGGNHRTSMPNVQPPSTQPPKEKSIICIQDPETFQDVTVNILYGERSNSNQSTSEPPSRKDSVSSEPSTQSQPNDVAIEFAAKIASVATNINPSRQEPVPAKSPLPSNMGIRLDNMAIPSYHGISSGAPLPAGMKLDDVAHQKRFMTENMPPPTRPNCLENITPMQITPCHPDDLTPPTRQLLNRRPGSNTEIHGSEVYGNGAPVSVEETVSVYELGQPIDFVPFDLTMPPPEAVVLKDSSIKINEHEVTNVGPKLNYSASSGNIQVQPSSNIIPPSLTTQESATSSLVPSNLPPSVETIVSDACSVKTTDDNVPMTNSVLPGTTVNTATVVDTPIISEPMQSPMAKESLKIKSTTPSPMVSSDVVSSQGPVASVPVDRTSNPTASLQGAVPAMVKELNYTSVSSTDRVPLKEPSVEKTVSSVETFSASIAISTLKETVVTTSSGSLSSGSEEIAADVSKPQHNGDLRETVSSPQLDSKDGSEARDGKKNRKKKMKELNRKGESRDGGEMDAFVDKEEEPTSLPASASPALPDTSETPSPPPVITTPTGSPVDVTPVDGDQEEVTEEERKVAEKNEENKRDSQKAIGDPTPVIQPPKPELPKYQYKEDQWSPLNPEGKKQYDRAFLITLQSKPMSLQKPRGLPNLDVIKDTASTHKLPDLRQAPAPVHGQTPAMHRNQHDLFIPQYARSGGGSPRPPQGSINRRQSQQGREKPKKIITFSSSLNEDVKLHEASNAWKPTHKVMTVAELNEEEKKTEELYRRVRGILNKLTPQKFTTLLEQVAELPIDTESRLKGVIDLVFEKAVDEPNFSVPYANMCKHLMMKAVPSDDEGSNVNFRKLLLTKCQREFEKDIKDETNRDNRLKQIEAADSDEKRKLLKEELADEERKVRRRCLGNIRFIGELYKLGMLTANIMHDCLGKLLKQGDEDSLECLCRLMTTIGKELDESAKHSAEKSEKRDGYQQKYMDGYFKTMKTVVESRHISSRVKFMLQDVIDLRLRNWVPRREDNNPKTIEQIHMEAQREAEIQQLQAQQPLPHMMPKRVDDRDRRKNRSMQGGYSEEGWNTVGGGKSRSTPFNSFDPSKLPPKITKPVEAEAIQLGPGGRGFSSWSRGSSGGGSKTLNQEPENKNPSNRFSALMNQEQNEPRRMIQHSSSSSREPSRGRQGQSQGQGSQLRNKTPSMSDRERQKAIAAVVAIKQNTVEPQTPEVTPKSSEVKEITVTPTPVPVTPEYIVTGGGMSYDDMEAKAKPLIDEFCHTLDFKEAVQCVVELVSPTTISVFVNVAINLVLERSSQAQTLLGQLLKDLVQKKIITLPQYVQGLQASLEIAEDLAIDVPKIWSCLAEVIAPMVQDGIMSMAFLKDAFQPSVENGVAAKIMPELLHSIANIQGPKKVHELWNNSGLKWSFFLSSNENEAAFIAEKKLEFTTQQEVDQSKVKRVSEEEAKKCLDSLLDSRKSTSNEDIFDWIEANIGEELIQTPPYIRALVTAVTESAITISKGQHQVEIKIFKDRIMLLKKYLENKEKLEIQALYALQALVTKLQHPQGMLVQIFNTLYDEEAMSEDAFFQWERSTDPAEQEGKGVAIKSVTSFFTWLQEADEDSVEEN